MPILLSAQMLRRSSVSCEVPDVEPQVRLAVFGIEAVTGETIF